MSESTTRDDFDELGGDRSGFTTITDSNCPQIERSEEYLEREDVRSFLNYLGGLLRGQASIRHGYKHAREGYEWQCKNLLDAARRYSFPVVKRFWTYTGTIDIRSLAANAIVLGRLQGDIRHAVAHQPPLEADAQRAAISILHWGGTDVRRRYNLEAVESFGNYRNQFVQYLELCRRSFGSGNHIDLSVFKNSGYGLRYNAGFTKIYSLVFNDFVIYDSRVAAGLGLLVIRWWALRISRPNRTSLALPESLQFLCMPTHNNPRRNPNSNCFNITGFPSGTGEVHHICHLQSNIRANWLLKQVLTGSDFEREINQHPHPYRVEPLRALEAALFMIGYDLAGNWPHIS